MDSYFDHAAAAYDIDFTYTEIGKMQRQLVYGFLEKRLAGCKDVFEVNCGTGEDAVWMAQKGMNVLATDISAEMVKRAKEKSAAASLQHIDFAQLDINKLSAFATDKKYDLVFSNFGGLNCLDHKELKAFLRNAKQKVISNTGSIVMVIMSKASLWESLFYLKKLHFKKAFRRNTNKALEVNVNGVMVPTYYYNPSFFRSLKDEFRIETIQTVGFFLPPSYLELIFSRRPTLLRLLSVFENKVKKIAALARFSDHYLIELKPL